jgi:hypothetical protein
MRDWLRASLLGLDHAGLVLRLVDGSPGENKNLLP